MIYLSVEFYSLRLSFVMCEVVGFIVQSCRYVYCHTAAGSDVPHRSMFLLNIILGISKLFHILCCYGLDSEEKGSWRRCWHTGVCG